QCSVGGSPRWTRLQRVAQPFERKRPVAVPNKSQNRLRRTEMRATFAVIFTIVAAASTFGQSVRPSSLRAGAAKVDVTPAERDLPKNYDGILDHIYSRAIVVESGNTSAALITVDAGGVPDQVWQNVTQQIQKELGIPITNVLLTATHTHSVPGQASPTYVAKIVESVRLAKQRLAPARVGYG